MTLPWLESVGYSVLTMAVEVTMRSTVLAAVCGAGAWLLRNRGVELRFALWRWMLFTLFALPALLVLTPPLQPTAHVLVQAEQMLLPPASDGAVSIAARPFPARPGRTEARGDRPAVWLVLPLALYVTMAGILLARLGWALIGLTRLTEDAARIGDARFKDLAHELWLESGAALRPAIAESAGVSVPVACEPLAFACDEPWILLPMEWRNWEEQKLRAVLTHELTHVRSRDSRTLLIAALATCVFWFHPLAWWLKRRLSTLAEEACDAVTIRSVTPEVYARVLIDFAEEVSLLGGRTVTGLTGMTGTPRLKGRLGRLFRETGRVGKPERWPRALCVVLFLPALYLTSAAHRSPPQPRPTGIDESIQMAWNKGSTLSPDEAADLASLLAKDPANAQARSELLAYSLLRSNAAQFAEQMLWFVEHHPESEILAMTTYPPKLLSGSDLSAIQAAWEKAIRENPDSARVLLHAAHFFKDRDPERSLGLLRNARDLDSAHADRYQGPIAGVYAEAEMSVLHPAGMGNLRKMRPDVAAKLHGELEASNNPALLAKVGQSLAL